MSAAALRHVFQTALGPCAIAWTDRGIRALALPGATAAATAAALGRIAGPAADGIPEGVVAEAVRRVTGLLAGASDNLLDIPLDETVVSDFERRVYAATRAVGPGCTTTYGAIAAAIGEPGAARAVGVALGRNPFAPIVPCHRVLAAGGAGGFSAPGGVSAKRRMLAVEGVHLSGGPTLFEHFGVAAPETGAFPDHVARPDR